MRRARRRSLLIALAMAGGFVALASPAPAPAAEGARVLMVDNEPDLTNWHFEPAEITVPAGTTVVWFNKGKQEHTVTADDKSFDSGMKKSGQSWERAFPKAGNYSYYCMPHPWMTGTVRVVAARTAAAAEPPATATTATTAAPPAPAAAGPTSTTFPPSLSAQRSEAPGSETPGSDTPAAPEPAPDPAEAPESPGDELAASPGGGPGGDENLLQTSALVLLPTLGALAVGARLRRRSDPAEV